jgi:hypothetical protein
VPTSGSERLPSLLLPLTSHPILLGAPPARHMIPLAPARSCLDKLAQHAKALIPALGGSCEEEDGPYLAINEVRRSLFHPARTLEEQKQVLNFLNHSLEVGGECFLFSKILSHDF